MPSRGLGIPPMGKDWLAGSRTMTSWKLRPTHHRVLVVANGCRGAMVGSSLWMLLMMLLLSASYECFWVGKAATIVRYVPKSHHHHQHHRIRCCCCQEHGPVPNSRKRNRFRLELRKWAEDSRRTTECRSVQSVPRPRLGMNPQGVTTAMEALPTAPSRGSGTMMMTTTTRRKNCGAEYPKLHDQDDVRTIMLRTIRRR